MSSDKSNKISSPPEANHHNTRSTRSTSGNHPQPLINHEHITDGTHGRPNAPFLLPNPRHTHKPQVHTPPPSTSPKSASSQNSFSALSKWDNDHDSNDNAVPVKDGTTPDNIEGDVNNGTPINTTNLTHDNGDINNVGTTVTTIANTEVTAPVEAPPWELLLQTMKDGMADSATRMDSLEASMTKRMDGLETSITGFQSSMYGMEKRMDSLETSITDFQSSMTTMDERANRIEKRVDDIVIKLKEQAESATTEISNVRSSVSSLQTLVEGVTPITHEEMTRIATDVYQQRVPVPAYAHPHARNRDTNSDRDNGSENRTEGGPPPEINPTNASGPTNGSTVLDEELSADSGSADPPQDEGSDRSRISVEAPESRTETNNDSRPRSTGFAQGPSVTGRGFDSNYRRQHGTRNGNVSEQRQSSRNNRGSTSVRWQTDYDSADYDSDNNSEHNDDSGLRRAPEEALSSDQIAMMMLPHNNKGQLWLRGFNTRGTKVNGVHKLTEEMCVLLNISRDIIDEMMTLHVAAIRFLVGDSQFGIRRKEIQPTKILSSAALENIRPSDLSLYSFATFIRELGLFLEEFGIPITPFNAIKVENGAAGLCLPGLGITGYNKCGRALLHVVTHLVPDDDNIAAQVKTVRAGSKNGYELLFRLGESVAGLFDATIFLNPPRWTNDDSLVSFGEHCKIYFFSMEQRRQGFSQTEQLIFFLENVRGTRYVHYASGVLRDVRALPQTASGFLPPHFSIDSIVLCMERDTRNTVSSSLGRRFIPRSNRNIRANMLNGAVDVDHPYDFDEVCYEEEAADLSCIRLPGSEAVVCQIRRDTRRDNPPVLSDQQDSRIFCDACGRTHVGGPTKCHFLAMYSFAKRMHGRMKENEIAELERDWVERNNARAQTRGPDRNADKYGASPRDVGRRYAKQLRVSENELDHILDRDLDWDYFYPDQTSVPE